jgi:repressor LexA
MKKKGDITTIYNYYAKHGRMPSYSEVAELFGFASKFSAYKKIHNFIESGLLEKDSKGKLLPSERGLLKQSLRGTVILGTVEAGFGSPYEETVNDKVTLDEWMIPHKANTYMLRVSGDSMKDAGILDGDMVLVEKTSQAKTGTIIIAEIDGAYTVKYLRKDKRGYYLEAGNEDYPDLRPEGELRIIARVIGSVRKYV